MTCYLEVKSCNLVINNLALFPYAPTIRGARHLEDLRMLKKEGYFAKQLLLSVKAGVEAYAFKCALLLQVYISETM
ncbi:MAG: DNA/RNA nuclease SfsA [Bacillota bacterium]